MRILKVERKQKGPKGAPKCVVTIEYDMCEDGYKPAEADATLLELFHSALKTIKYKK